jgi:drug/metabolite transporter (DMT)-like permease
MSEPVRDRAAELRALRKVQQRVAAIAFFAVAIHGVIGLIVVARVVDGQGRRDDAVILTLLSAVFAVVTVVVVRAILRKKNVFAPLWVVGSVVPSVVALFLL